MMMDKARIVAAFAQHGAMDERHRNAVYLGLRGDQLVISRRPFDGPGNGGRETMNSAAAALNGMRSIGEASNRTM